MRNHGVKIVLKLLILSQNGLNVGIINNIIASRDSSLFLQEIDIKILDNLKNSDIAKLIANILLISKITFNFK